MAHRVWSVAAACALASCSGGTDDAAQLTFSPATLRATSWQGDAQSATVAISYRNISGQVSVRVVDAEGILRGDLGLENRPQESRYIATVNLSTSLAPGVHTGALQVFLCRDSPLACNDPVPGSPWLLPYEITVLANVQTPLAALPEARPWATWQGNAAHDGHVPAPALDPARFTRRWTFRTAAYTAAVAVATEGGRVFAATFDYLGSTWRLRAFDEDTGQELWTADIGRRAVEVTDVHTVATAGGRVFLTMTPFTSTCAWVCPPEIRVFDAASGAPVTTFVGPTTPTPFEGAVYGDFGGPVAGSRLELPDLTETWTAPCPYGACVHLATSAVDADRVYAMSTFRLETWRRSDGAPDFGIEDQTLLLGSPTVPSPRATVLGGDGSVFFTQAEVQIGCWDTVAGTLKWRVSGDFRTDPVLAGGVLYVIRETATAWQLEARSPATGAALWSTFLSSNYDATWLWWTPPPRVVAVGDLVLANTIESVVAIDPRTHAVVWQHPDPGVLAVSENGVLYVGADAALYAVNLALAP